jgi:hypothetical protein
MGRRTCGGEHGNRHNDAGSRTNRRGGFQAIELIALRHLKQGVRELREDPFERVRVMNTKNQDNAAARWATDPRTIQMLKSHCSLY